MLFLLMLSAILEKFQWRFAGLNFSLYMIVGTVYFVSVMLKEKGKIKLLGKNRQFMMLKSALIFYSLTQIIFINHLAGTYDQLFKGFFSLIIDFMIIIAFVCSVNSGRISYKDVLNLFYNIGCINIIYNILQRIYTPIDNALVYAFRSTTSRYGLDPYGQLGRLTGLFTDSNNNGVFLVVTLVIFVCSSKYLEKNRIINKVFVLLCIASISLTFSITAYIGSVIFGAYYLYKNNMKKQIRFLGILLIICMIALFVYSKNIAIQQIIGAKINNLLSAFEKSTHGSGVISHFQLAVYSLEIWLFDVSTMVFGTGNNCMDLFFGEMFGLPGYKAHNYYLQNLAEFGVFGFAIVVLIMNYYFSFIKLHRKEDWYLKAILVIVFVANLTYDSMVQPFFSLIVFLCISYYTTALKKIKNEGENNI